MARDNYEEGYDHYLDKAYNCGYNAALRRAARSARSRAGKLPVFPGTAKSRCDCEVENSGDNPNCTYCALINLANILDKLHEKDT